MVGIGPGSVADRTHRAEAAIAQSQVVVGYGRYLRAVADLTAGKALISSGMKEEVARCRAAVQLARDGQVVALISSGDAGIYGMAGLAIELAAAEGTEVDIEIVPGVTAASAAAARLGAPLMLDFAVVSLSDLLIPWETIRRRVEAIAAADMVLAIYNPRSRQRVRQLEETVEILLRSRPPETPVGIARSVGDDDERITVSTLGKLLDQDIDMRHRAHRRQQHGPHDRWLVPRLPGLPNMILLLGGTSETGEIAAALSAAHDVLVSTASDEPLEIPAASNVRRRCGRLDDQAMLDLVRGEGITAIVDAAHPYAAAAHATAWRVAQAAAIPYLRFERPPCIDAPQPGCALHPRSRPGRARRRFFWPRNPADYRREQSRSLRARGGAGRRQADRAGAAAGGIS